jgi:hypothetical protein
MENQVLRLSLRVINLTTLHLLNPSDGLFSIFERSLEPKISPILESLSLIEKSHLRTQLIVLSQKTESRGFFAADKSSPQCCWPCQKALSDRA